MKNVFLLFLCTVIAWGCTTLRQTQVSADDAQRLIVSGQLLKPRDKVSLTTQDGKIHQFTVNSIDVAAGTVEGSGDSVRVAEIVTVAKREPAPGKTIGLVVGIVGGLQLGAAVADPFPFD